ncbi:MULTISPECIES: DUF2634 domain-containing protein [unclassified Brevibacillus]|jgi:hypothetical protein|uniref:DUF2634 domain-containing protein n=1 Tax=unclassified Brevibacillus TaxID=2684853 RepID=UPI0014929DBF|nr:MULTISPECIES: DUF2634 domain-containing protein [unclassified Brevibacillus]MBR8659560.1 DUF2634 domain-containing protein [Brevibacillus sp. NL20B1]NNV01945.1 DUF2634 domain-containing protein [Brevibacillus sp. MCWH]
MTLPQIAQLEFPDTELIQQTSPEKVHKTFLWDFNKGDFVLKDGKLIEVTGIEYVKIWVEKALRTMKDSLIYEGTGYGSEYHTLIGKNFHPDFTRSEYERMIRDALLQNDAITQVDNFVFTQSGEKLTIEFQVKSIYGSTEGRVTV